VELGISDPVGVTLIPVFGKDMNRDGNRPSGLLSQGIYEGGRNFVSQNLRDRRWSSSHLGENDAKDGPLLVPADQISFTRAAGDNADRPVKDSFRRTVALMSIEQHQDERLAGSFGAAALQGQHGMKNIL